MRTGAISNARRSIAELHAQLELPGVISGGERQRVGGVAPETDDRAGQLLQRQVAHNVVYALEVRVVQQVEGLRRDIQTTLLFMPQGKVQGQPHVRRKE